MKKTLFILGCFFLSLRGFAQSFIPPLTQFATTESFGFKKEIKTVTEYTTDIHGQEQKRVLHFSKEGFLVKEESFAYDEPDLYYDKSDEQGRHLDRTTAYQFEDGRLTKIILSEVTRVLEEQEDGFLQEKGAVSSTEDYPYWYDGQNRLIAYTVKDPISGGKASVHLHYTPDRLTQYFSLSPDGDSLLVYTIQTVVEGDRKKVIHTTYERGHKSYAKEIVYQKGQKILETITRYYQDGTESRIARSYNPKGDILKIVSAERSAGNPAFETTDKAFYRYDYDDNGVKRRTFSSKDSVDFVLNEETIIRNENGAKTVITRTYNESGIWEGESLTIYNNENELISKEEKSIYGEYGKLFSEPVTIQRIIYEYE